MQIFLALLAGEKLIPFGSGELVFGCTQENRTKATVLMVRVDDQFAD
jgi:hypothetical protein